MKIEQPKATPPLANPTARLRVLVERANQGDQNALAELRLFLDANPAIWRTCGDLGRVAERAWLDVLLGTNVLARESVQRYLGAMKTELVGPEPTTLEILLADEIGVAYLAKQHAEIGAAGAGGGSLAQAAFRWRRLEGAARHFLRALKTLADVRTVSGRLTVQNEQGRPLEVARSL